MENEYLWNKTGEDAEIEQLETALMVFRHQENEAPRLPIKVMPAESRVSFFSWRLAFTFAVILTLLGGGLSLWLKLQTKDEGHLTAANSASEKEKTLPVSSPSAQPTPERIVLPTENKTTTKPKVFNAAFRPVEVVKKSNSTIKRKAETKIQLTKEEKFAFDQLMLALSITGSKLKEVQDKANGGEETSPLIKSFK